jgi:cytosine/adenosine deaminase-related metal-dependent hydrolase
MAHDYQIPLATHLAETREELELLENHRGPLVEFLRELGVWDPEGLVRGPTDIVRQGSLAPNFLIVHGNWLSGKQLGENEDQRTVVHCPRTSFALVQVPNYFPSILFGGGRVSLGTDSLASNPDLDLLAEARFLHRYNDHVPGQTFLRMITLSGAEALGWDQETGSLSPGKSADLVVLPLPPIDAKDPHDLIFQSDFSPSKVMCRGAWIYGEPDV